MIYVKILTLIQTDRHTDRVTCRDTSYLKKVWNWFDPPPAYVGISTFFNPSPSVISKNPLMLQLPVGPSLVVPLTIALRTILRRRQQLLMKE